MPRRVALALALAVFVQVVGAAPKPKDDEKEVLYFPTTVGDTAVYETTLRGDLRYEHTQRVKKVAKEADGVRVTVEDKELGRPAEEYEVVASAAGLLHTRSLGRALDPPAPDLRLPAKAGDKWAWDTPKWTTRYTVVGEDEVKVPAGKFKAVRVRKERTDGKPRAEVWSAPRVGLVKQVFDVGDDTQQVQVLKSFTPADKK